MVFWLTYTKNIQLHMYRYVPSLNELKGPYVTKTFLNSCNYYSQLIIKFILRSRLSFVQIYYCYYYYNILFIFTISFILPCIYNPNFWICNISSLYYPAQPLHIMCTYNLNYKLLYRILFGICILMILYIYNSVSIHPSLYISHTSYSVQTYPLHTCKYIYNLDH